MKTLLKLVFIGIIIGVTIYALDEKEINVKETARHIVELARQKIEQLEQLSQEEPDQQRDIAEPVSPSSESGKSITTTRTYNSPDKAKPRIDLTDTNIESVEIPIRYKPGHNKRFEELDQYAASVPEAFEDNLDALVNYLVKPAKNNIERTRLVFSWIAFHVSYDDHGYNTGRYGDLSAEGVFNSRVAVCQGFSELFKIMGEKAGLDIVLVTGYAKGISYRAGQSFNSTNHAWNLVYIENRWRHFDVTWAQGYGTAVNGKLVSIKKFEDYWFNIPADEFIFSHLPENPKWQLTSIPLSKTQYERLPHARASYFKIGFDGTRCLQQSVEGSLTSFPKTYQNDGSVRALSLPHRKEIQAHQPITIRLRTERSADIAIINNGKWVHLRKDGNEYMAIINPQPGILTLSARLDNQSSSYNTLLEYRVN